MREYQEWFDIGWNAPFLWYLLALLLFSLLWGRLLWHRFIAAPTEPQLYKGSLDQTVDVRMAELRESGERYALAMLVANDGIWDCSLDEGSVRFDARYYTMAGYQPDEFPHQREEWEQRIHPDDIASVQLAFKQYLSGERESYQVEFRFRCKAGDYIWIESKGVVVSRDVDGTPLRFVGTHSDISARKQLEAERSEFANRLQQIAAKVPGMVYQFKLYPDGSACFPYASAAMLKMFRSEPEEAQKDATNVFSVIERNDIDAVFASIQKSASSKSPWEQEFRVRDETGQLRWLYGASVPDQMPGADGSVLWHGIVTDITEQKQAQEQLRLAASVFEHSQQGVMITDAENRIIDINPAYLEMTGYSRQEVLGQGASIFNSGLQDDSFYADRWQVLKEYGCWEGELWNRTKSGELFAERLTINIVLNEHDQLQHYVAVASDITHLKKHENELTQLAFNDPLTGLPNRRLLDDRMQQALVLAQRHEKRVAVCYLDLDGFKPVNDTYGHKVGDQVLVEIAARLQRSVREGDTVARLGGDEFALLILDIGSTAALEEVIKRTLQMIAQPCRLPDGDVLVSASIGIALYPEDDSEAETLLRHADHAMYRAKQQGKNRYHFFDPAQERRMGATQLLQHEIEVALEEQQLRLFYQPKVNMRTGEVIGLEALIRWQHPQQGLLLPAAFLPMIENHSLIVNVGHWVLRQVFLQQRAWRAQGVELPVSVNIAAQQLEQTDFIASLKILLSEFSDIPPELLELEILETAAMYDIGHVSRIMSECAVLGINFALDDFGTGYSSLTYLKSLPIKVIKIDQSFVRDLLHKREDMVIIQAILGLARAFDRTPIAEGVETVQHGMLLLNLGCELGQGYGIARPMSAAALPGWLGQFQVAAEWRET